MKKTLENQFTSLAKIVKKKNTNTIEQEAMKILAEGNLANKEKTEVIPNVSSLFIKSFNNTYQLYRLRNGSLKIMKIEDVGDFFYMNNYGRMVEFKYMYGRYILTLGKVDKTLYRNKKCEEGMISF